MPNKNVLITGAAGVLGPYFVRLFAAQGWHVVCSVRNAASYERLLRNIPVAEREQLSPVLTDLTVEGTADKIAEELQARGVLIHALVNNAFDQKASEYDTSGFMPRTHWNLQFMLAVVVPYELSIAFTRRFHGTLSSIVNIASMYGVTAPNRHLYESPLESPISYGPAKAAMIHLTKELAVRLAPEGIRVNAISFGGISGRVDESFKGRYKTLCPMGRMLEPEETATHVVFLASDASIGMTGHNMVVDGGWTIW